MTGSDNRIQQPYLLNVPTSKLPVPLKFFFPNKITRNTNQNTKMATSFLSTANAFLSCTLASSSSSSSSSSLSVCLHKHNAKRQQQTALSKAFTESPLPSPCLTKRSLSVCFISSFVFSMGGKGCFDANAAILEADDDQELLEKVKRDRKKRLERQGVISSSKVETGLL